MVVLTGFKRNRRVKIYNINNNIINNILLLLLLLLTDEVLVLKVLPSGLRAGSLLRAANDNTISSYANVLTKTVNDLGLGPNRILTKLN